MIIYEAINIVNKKRYIGQTINSLAQRKRQHLESVNYDHLGCTLFKRALTKYGVSSFEWKIIDYAFSKEELDEKESFWINFFKTTDTKYGYNLKGGGAKPFLTASTKKAIGDAQRGVLNHMYGRRGKDNPSSLVVKDITTGEVFNGVSELCRIHNEFEVSKVCAVCRGERYTHKKHTFRYLDSEGNIIQNGNPVEDEKIKALKREHTKFNQLHIKVLDTTNNIVYESLSEAVGRKYISSFSRKLKQCHGECSYHGIQWVVL